jgi:hypothetical protein
MSISASDRDLAQLAADSRPDKTLAVLAGLGSAGIKCVLGLLVNGMTIYGHIESPGTVFAELDAENARMMERQRSAKDKESKEASPLEDVWTRKFEEGERQEEQIMERTEGKALEEMTEEDVRATIERQTTTLTLADVHVFPPASAGFEVPLMRVRIAQVNAWWLIPTDAEGNASFSHPVVGGGN